MIRVAAGIRRSGGETRAFVRLVHGWPGFGYTHRAKYRNGGEMAWDTESEITRHRQEWEGFAKLLFITTAGVIVVLGLLALTVL